MTTLEIVLLLLVGALLILALLLSRGRGGADRHLIEERDRLAQRLEQLSRETARQEALLESAEAERTRGRERMDRELQGMTERFESLSEVITKRRADELSAANSRELTQLLTPLRESLQQMDQALKRAGEQDAHRAGQLEGQIQALVREAQTVGSKADRLAEAMSTSGKVQGDWGEMQLELLLERAGFHPGEEYDSQVVLRRAGKILRPDCVLHFPDGRDLMIDSKVSLRAYVRYMEATDEEARHAALADLERDLRSHVRELTDKRYHQLQTAEGRSTFPYTLMFVPNTAALLLVRGSTLSADALAGGVMLVTPESLLLFVRIIAEAWVTYRQEASTAEVMQLAAKVVWQADNMMRDLELIGSKLDDAKRAYEETVTHLRGRQGLVTYASQIRDRIE